MTKKVPLFIEYEKGNADTLCWVIVDGIHGDRSVLHKKVTLIDGESMCGTDGCINPDHVQVTEECNRASLWAVFLIEKRVKDAPRY